MATARPCLVVGVSARPGPCHALRDAAMWANRLDDARVVAVHVLVEPAGHRMVIELAATVAEWHHECEELARSRAARTLAGWPAAWSFVVRRGDVAKVLAAEYARTRALAVLIGERTAGRWSFAKTLAGRLQRLRIPVLQCDPNTPRLVR